MRKAQLIGLIILVVAIDWGVKWWVYHNMELGVQHPVLQFGEWGLSFTRAHNYGAAFSFLSGQGGWQRYFFLAIGIIAVYLLSNLIKDLPPERKMGRAGLALIIAGAIGNMGDRFLLGYVIDYIDVKLAGWNFYVFNIADIAISIGATLWVLDQLYYWYKGRQHANSVVDK